MTETYPTFLFIEMLNDLQPKVLYIREEVIEELRIMVYQGVRGNVVIIDVSDEDIDSQTAKGHLYELGLGHIAETLFPNKASLN